MKFASSFSRNGYSSGEDGESWCQRVSPTRGGRAASLPMHGREGASEGGTTLAPELE